MTCGNALDGVDDDVHRSPSHCPPWCYSPCEMLDGIAGLADCATCRVCASEVVSGELWLEVRNERVWRGAVEPFRANGGAVAPGMSRMHSLEFTVEVL